MSSYNNVEKIKYSSDDCVVTLDEYIVFEDERAEQKYVVFKFSNNVNQQLLGMEFEVSQYDIDNNLVEKSVVIYDKFLAKPVQSFVPNAKLKVNYACKTLKVRLIQAAFDRYLWKEGEFLDNSYKFKHYAEDEDKETAKKAVPVAPVYIFPPNPALPPKGSKNKLPFNAKNTTRKNLAKFPAILNTFACILGIAAIIFAVFHFTKTSNTFTADGFDVKVLDNNTVSILGYNGEDKEVAIPATINDYTVVRINKEAFMRSDIETVRIDSTQLYIEEYAFSGCTNLKTVDAEGEITVHSYAFYNCTALTTIGTPHATFLKNSLKGCTSLNLLIGIIGADIVDDLFGGEAPAELKVWGP